MANISTEEHKKIVELHNKGKSFYEIAETVFKFENEQTVAAVRAEVEAAEEAGEFVAPEDKKDETKKSDKKA